MARVNEIPKPWDMPHEPETAVLRDSPDEVRRMCFGQCGDTCAEIFCKKNKVNYIFNGGK